MSTPYQFSIEIEKASAWEDSAMEMLDLVESCKRDGGFVITRDNLIAMLSTRFTSGHWIIHVKRA